MARQFIDAIQTHWTPRLAVFLWDRLELSRRECDDQRHLLSCKYLPPPLDKYVPMKVWEHPQDSDDFVAFPLLPGRHAREKEYAKLAAESQIQVSATGRSCQRDAKVAATEMYSAYRQAMRTNFSKERPAMPTYLFDGTGQSLGKPLCHAEMGSADFIGDCKQSRKTLQPLQASEGNDHAISIRDTMDYAARTYNELIAAKEITLDTGDTIPAKPIASADFQTVKAKTATSEQTHSIWCTCLPSDGCQHKYADKLTQMDGDDPDSIEAAYDNVIHFIERDAKGPRCKFKRYDDICRWNHYCPNVARGGPFRRFKCELCNYNPTAAEWTADMNEFAAKDDDEQKSERKAHRENGCQEYSWRRHHYGEKFMCPMLHLDPRDIGVDMLHLVYLNLFKHLFNYTVHQPLPGRRARAHTCSLVVADQRLPRPQRRKRKSCVTTSLAATFTRTTPPTSRRIQ